MSDLSTWATGLYPLAAYSKREDVVVVCALAGSVLLGIAGYLVYRTKHRHRS